MMDTIAIKTFVRQAVLWCVLVLAAGLLTLLFTVLGTITCAVLTGMMMGAARHERWHTIPVSIVFPGVVVTLVQVAKVELVGTQRILLPALCFGAFWLMYLLTRALVSFEQKMQNTQAADPPVAAQNVEPELARESQLGKLQGRWTCEINGHKPGAEESILEIAGNHFLLVGTASDGRTRLMARGNLELDGAKDAPDGAAGQTRRGLFQSPPDKLAPGTPQA